MDLFLDIDYLMQLKFSCKEFISGQPLVHSEELLSMMYAGHDALQETADDDVRFFYIHFVIRAAA